jgi:phenylpyruvate tautomerase PptA (4-oxalocrotonate tautomerase family)
VPILDVQIVGDLPAEIREGLAAHLADAAAEVLSSRPAGTWVKLQALPRADYAENGGGPEGAIEPVFVRVLLRAVPQGEALRAQAHALTQAIAAVCGRSPDDVHVLYEPAAAGRIAFGGRLVDGE